MYEGDERLIPHKVRVSTRIVLAWQFWAKGIMGPKQAIRTFFAKAA